MKLLVIDGQGGKMGKALVEEIKTARIIDHRRRNKQQCHQPC